MMKPQDDYNKCEENALISLAHVWKSFRLWHQKNTSLRSMLFGAGSRGVAETKWALKDISLCLHEGETLGIIGPNGSGKSTLLKLIAGVYEATRGDINRVRKVSALLELGVGFHPELSGIDNILLNAAVHGISRKETMNMMEEIIDFSGLAEFADVPVRYYSTGMLSRLGFAAASLLDPEVLLIDEIYAVGDAEFQEKSITRLHELMESSKAIIIVSHNMNLIKSICTRAAFIHEGELKSIGDPVEVVNAYLKILGERP